jgi:membrane associated rhomboid family serine protease
MREAAANIGLTTMEQERLRSLVYPVFGALVVPIAVGLLAPGMLRSIVYLFYASALIIPSFIALKIGHDCVINSDSFFRSFFRHFKPIPPMMVCGTDAKTLGFPWTTFVLVLTNVVLFNCASDELIEEWVFLPFGDPSSLDVVKSMFTCAFLHGSLSHLVGNIIFLWVFGSAVEPRVGSLRFLVIYFVCILASNALVGILLLLKANVFDSPEIVKDFHSLGASGVISGIMGIFAVRCYFARVTLTLPFLFLPFLSIPVRVPGTVLIGIFFAMDMAGGMRQFTSDTQIDFWAHVGGYLGGVGLGYLLDLNKVASSEAVEARAERLGNAAMGKEEAVKMYKEILERDPNNETALRFLFERYRLSRTRGGLHFRNLIEFLVKKDFGEAVRLVEEYYPRFIKGLSGNVLLRLGNYYREIGEFDRAWYCLEAASEKEGPWQAKSLMCLARTYDEMGRLELARETLNEIMNLFPNSPFQKVAAEELEAIG